MPDSVGERVPVACGRPGSFFEAEARDVLETMDELLHQVFVLRLGRYRRQPRDNSVDNFSILP